MWQQLSGTRLPRLEKGGLPTGPKGCAGADLAVPLLRVNDWLLRINDVDLINKDKKQAIKALLNGEGAINMVVRRRKSLGGKVVTPLHINLNGQKGSGPVGVSGASQVAWCRGGVSEALMLLNAVHAHPRQGPFWVLGLAGLWVLDSPDQI